MVAELWLFFHVTNELNDTWLMCNLSKKLLASISVSTAGVSKYVVYFKVSKASVAAGLYRVVNIKTR